MPRPRSRRAPRSGTLTTAEMVMQARDMLHFQEYHKSAALLSRALARNPRDKAVLCLRAQALMHLGLHELAWTDLELALRVDSFYPAALFTKAMIVHKCGRPGEALQLYRDAVNLEPGNETYRCKLLECAEEVQKMLRAQSNDYAAASIKRTIHDMLASPPLFGASSEHSSDIGSSTSAGSRSLRQRRRSASGYDSSGTSDAGVAGWSSSGPGPFSRGVRTNSAPPAMVRRRRRRRRRRARSRSRGDGPGNGDNGATSGDSDSASVGFRSRRVVMALKSLQGDAGDANKHQLSPVGRSRSRASSRASSSAASQASEQRPATAPTRTRARNRQQHKALVKREYPVGTLPRLPNSAPRVVKPRRAKSSSTSRRVSQQSEHQSQTADEEADRKDDDWLPPRTLGVGSEALHSFVAGSVAKRLQTLEKKHFGKHPARLRRGTRRMSMSQTVVSGAWQVKEEAIEEQASAALLQQAARDAAAQMDGGEGSKEMVRRPQEYPPTAEPMRKWPSDPSVYKDLQRKAERKLMRETRVSRASSTASMASSRSRSRSRPLAHDPSGALMIAMRLKGRATAARLQTQRCQSTRSISSTHSSNSGRMSIADEGQRRASSSSSATRRPSRAARRIWREQMAILGSVRSLVEAQKDKQQGKEAAAAETDAAAAAAAAAKVAKKQGPSEAMSAVIAKEAEDQYEREVLSDSERRTRRPSTAAASTYGTSAARRPSVPSLQLPRTRSQSSISTDARSTTSSHWSTRSRLSSRAGVVATGVMGRPEKHVFRLDIRDTLDSMMRDVDAEFINPHAKARSDDRLRRMIKYDRDCFEWQQSHSDPVRHAV